MEKIGRVIVAALTMTSLVSCANLEKSATCRESPRPIVATHTFIPYHPISVRLNEQGITKMTVTVGSDGVPTDVIVKQTSSSDRLDTAAVNYIKAHWRWQPPNVECAPATAAVDVAWHIAEPPTPKSGLKMQRGLEIMTIYTPRIHQIYG